MVRRISQFSIIVMIIAALFIGCNKPAAKDQAADLVLRGGKIVTMDKAKPMVEALAVREGRILAVGTLKEIEAYVSKTTKVIDLEGKLVIPGLIESHGHFSGLGYARMRLDLNRINNWDDAVALVAAAVKKAKPGEWILGRGWHQEKWDKVPEPNVDGLPIHTALSNVSPDNPVYLRHASGHASYANAKAMALAGVDKTTVNPEGGEIVKDSNGDPIGVFRETASALIGKALNKYRAGLTDQEKQAEALKAIELADAACLANGITSFHDAGVSFAAVDIYKNLVTKNALATRLNVMLSASNPQLKARIAEYRIIGMANNHLTVRSIKRLIDGALGSHGAWLLEPYTSLPSSSGLNTEPIPDMKEVAAIAIENGFQLCTHAIGDRGNREILDIYEETFKKHSDKKDLRWRIEHAQHLDPQDIPRFAKLGVIAAMQSVHCTSDGPWVPKRIGDKRSEAGAYVWQKLMATGAIICNGTDVPVEDVSPMACYYSAVNRKMKNGKIFYGKQKMSREEALRSYTYNAAYAAFEEDIKGSLTPGKLADITVLSKDILTIPEEDILKTEAIYTIIGGKIMYQKKNFTANKVDK
jgi:predicted amidohydrolase YtcJ